MNLRPRQLTTFADVTAAVRRGKKRILMVAPTGSGKGVLTTEFLRRAALRGVPGIHLTNSQELVAQAAVNVRKCGLPVGVIQGDSDPLDPTALIQVCSIPTLARRGTRPPAGVIIVDEARHATGAQWRSVLSAYPNAIVIGADATPVRMDATPMGDVFEEIVTLGQIGELIEEGWLARPRTFDRGSVDLSSVATRHGDYDRKQAAAVMNTPKLVGDVVESWQRLAAGRTTFVFAQNVAHSIALRDRFRAAGVAAEHVQASTPRAERKRIFDGLRDGSITVLCNVNVATEGIDVPRVSCVSCARATQSPSLYRQMGGRMLRLWCPVEGCDGRACGHEGAKTDAILIDHTQNTQIHGLLQWDQHYTLEGREKRTGVPGVSVRRCLACFAAFPASMDECPECHEPVPVQPAKPIKEAAGELTELTPARAYALKADQERLVGTLAKFVRTARLKGYKPGWARCAFRGMTNRWPSVAELRRAEEMA